jgi:carbonic anhydrase
MIRIFLFIVACSVLVAEKTSPEKALNKLITGNTRAIEGKIEHPNYFNESKMQSLALKQEPFAVIVACSDSRVSPEILFDQGIGDLFVVRVAGKVFIMRLPN